MDQSDGFPGEGLDLAHDMNLPQLQQLQGMDPSTAGRGDPSTAKDDVHKTLGRAIILPVIDGKYRSPVVTLQNDGIGTLYTVIEKHLRSEFLVGSEKFWKLVRADQSLDTWRPRVHGTQLKALLNSRLPETDLEFSSVESALAGVQQALRPDSSPQAFVADLRKYISNVEVWWDNRNSRRAEGQTKRPNPTPPAPSNKVAKKDSLYPAQGGQGTPSYSMGGASGGQPAGGAYYGAGGYGGSGKYYSGGYPTDLMGLANDALEHEGKDMMAGGYSNGMAGAGPSSGGGAGDSGAAAAAIYGVGGKGPTTSTLSNPRSVIALNVGGKRFMTLACTLAAVPNSYFWNLVHGAMHDDTIPRTMAGEIFIDRSGQLFRYVVEYLRAVSNKDPAFVLPSDAQELQALGREAEFYGLPGLLERCYQTALMPQPGTRAMYDSLYLETGFNSIEGSSLKEMEQRKVVVMQQMNQVLSQKSQDGFFVESCDCGVNHREAPDGAMQHNLYYHILLKKVALQPQVLPQGATSGRGR